MSNKNTRPFDLEHAKAGAPFACATGASVQILKWDCRGVAPLAGIASGDSSDFPALWHADGRNFSGHASSLVMTPLGFIEGKPFFVGDSIIGNLGQSFTAEPRDKDGTHDTWRWPAPATAYPETGAQHREMFSTYASHLREACGYTTVIAETSGLEAVANAALRHAIDAGQVVTADAYREALAKMSRVMEGAEAERRPVRDRAIAIAMRTACERQVGHVIPMNPDAVIATVP